jgi:hypothetical protein
VAFGQDEGAGEPGIVEDVDRDLGTVTWNRDAGDPRERVRSLLLSFDVLVA